MRELTDVVAGEQVKPAVADMPNRQTVALDGRGDDGGAHPGVLL